MSELKEILCELSRRLKSDLEVIQCDDGEKGSFIPKGCIDSNLSVLFAEVDRGEFDHILNKIKASALREWVDSYYTEDKVVKVALFAANQYANKLEQGDFK